VSSRTADLELRRAAVTRSLAWLLCVLLVGCAAGSRRQLAPLAPQLASVRSLAVTSSACWAPEAVERALVARLAECKPSMMTPAEPEGADLLIEWEEQDCTICLDYWDTTCDLRALRVHLSLPDGSAVEWFRKRPGWCNEEDCLLDLFARDLAFFACSSG
jgi:hypothetical protein